jgi:hypothetical protein
MTVADRLADSAPVENHVDIGLDGGEFSNFRTDAPVTNWDDALRKLGVDPEFFMVVGDTIRVSSWQQSKALEDGTRDLVTLYSYAGQITSRREAVNLPALYAEVARTKHRPIKSKTGAATLVVCWADIQTGKVDHLGTTADLLERLELKRVELETHLRKTPFDRIVVADVGDIVEGIENTSSQLATNDLSLMDQIDVAATELWKTIRLCARFAPVDVLSIPSNHAQLRRGKGLIGKPTDDWGLHISKRLEHLNAEVGLPVTFHRPADWEETLTFDVRGTRLGLAHGHQATSPDRVRDWWAKMGHAGVMNCDILLTGHYHFVNVRPSGRNHAGKLKWHLQAPTLDNGSAWVNNTIGEDGDPALMVFAIDDDGFAMSGLSLL